MLKNTKINKGVTLRTAPSSEEDATRVLQSNAKLDVVTVRSSSVGSNVMMDLVRRSRDKRHPSSLSSADA
jgi:hypothetical protein